MSIPIGTCSECGGPVVVPEGAVHATPHCAHCGALAKNPHGPVIPMERRRIPRDIDREFRDQQFKRATSANPYDLSDPKHPARLPRKW